VLDCDILEIKTNAKVHHFSNDFQSLENVQISFKPALPPQKKVHNYCNISEIMKKFIQCFSKTPIANLINTVTHCYSMFRVATEVSIHPCKPQTPWCVHRLSIGPAKGLSSCG